MVLSYKSLLTIFIAAGITPVSNFSRKPSIILHLYVINDQKMTNLMVCALLMIMHLITNTITT